MSKFNYFLPINKVVEQVDGTVMVYARGTQEIPDRAGEIFDYASSVPRIMKWSEDTFKRSNGLSYGNIRAMHAKQASGKLNEPVIYRDDEKAIDLVVKVVDPDDCTKVREGVYTGMSIGGDYAARWPDPQNPRLWRYTAEPTEFSLVDAPAVPTATFQMIKLDGTSEMRKFVAAEINTDTTRKDDSDVDQLDTQRMEESPAPDVIAIEHAPAPETVTGEIPVVSGDPIPPNPLTHGVHEVQPGDNPTPDMQKIADLINSIVSRMDRFADATENANAIRKADADAREKAEAMLKSLGSRVGIARREGELSAAPGGYPTDSSVYGDPANWAWACDTAERCRSAIAAFNTGVYKAKYSEREWHLLGRRVTQRVTTLLGKHLYDPKRKQITKVEVKKMEVKKDAAGSVMTDLRSAAQNAIENINDPQAVLSALQQILAGIDVATDASKLPVASVSGAASSLAAAASGGSAGAAGADEEDMQNMAKRMAALETSQSKILDLLTKMQTPVQQTAPVVPAAPVQKALTLGDLNAQVQKPGAAGTPLEKAIGAVAANFGEGVAPDMLAAVMEASGGNAILAQNKAVELARQSLAKRGFNSASRLRGIDPTLLAQYAQQTA